MFDRIRNALRSVFGLRGLPLKDPALTDLWSAAPPTSSGANVDDDSAMTLNAFYSCVRVIANGFAMLPLKLYRRLPDGGREEARDHALWRVLCENPNPWMTGFTFRQTLTQWAARKNMAFAEKVFNNAGELVELWPIPTPLVEVVITDDGEMVYDVTVPGVAKRQRLSRQRMFRWCGFSPNGITGFDVTQMHREAIGLGLSIQEYIARFFGNNSRPGGVIEVPNMLGEEGRKRLKAGWEIAQGGLKNAHRVAVLEQGAKWVAMSSTNQDSQLLELLGKGRKHISALLGVPLSKIQDIENASYATLEQEDISFMVHCLGPWLTSFEEEVSLQLIAPSERAEIFAKHRVQAAQRGAFRDRVEGYRTLWNIGAISNDDIRALEDMNPLPDKKGGDYIIPLNVQALAPGGAASMPGTTQIQTMADVAAQVASGELPPECGKALLAAVFPGLDEKKIAAIIDPAAKHAESKPAAPQLPPAPMDHQPPAEPPHSVEPKPAEDPTSPQ